MTANEAGKMTESAVKTHSADALNRFIDRRIGEAARAGADYIRDAGAYPSSTSATLHDFPLDSLMGQFRELPGWYLEHKLASYGFRDAGHRRPPE